MRVQWFAIQHYGFLLYGFVLYKASNVQVCEFMALDGLAQIDVWTGDETAIFSLSEPNDRWRRYAAQGGGQWQALFGDAWKAAYEERARLPIPDLEVSDADGEPIGLRTLVGSQSCEPFWGLREVEAVRRTFGLEEDQVPCVYFFYDLDDPEGYIAVLPRFEAVVDVEEWFRLLFTGPELRTLVEGSPHRLQAD